MLPARRRLAITLASILPVFLSAEGLDELAWISRRADVISWLSLVQCS